MMRPAEHVAWELLTDGSLMVCHLPTGTVLELSAPAGVLWNRLAEGATVADLAALLEGPTAAQDAEAFCHALAERDLLAQT